MAMMYGTPMPPADRSQWLEPRERVLWRGKPAVDRRLRTRLWARVGFGVAAIFIVGPLIDRSFYGSNLILAVVGGIIALGAVLYVPRYMRNLANMEYFVTSRRAVVVGGRNPASPRVTWVLLDVDKIRIKRRRDGSADFDWGRCSGRISDGESPLVQIGQALGFVDRSDKERVTFVEIRQPDPLFSAIRGGRAALGLPTGFD
jgi:hypothetical protein